MAAFTFYFAHGFGNSTSLANIMARQTYSGEVLYMFPTMSKITVKRGGACMGVWLLNVPSC